MRRWTVYSIIEAMAIVEATLTFYSHNSSNSSEVSSMKNYFDKVVSL